MKKVVNCLALVRGLVDRLPFFEAPFGRFGFYIILYVIFYLVGLLGPRFS